MTTKNTKTNHEAEIRSLVDHWANAVRSKDAEGVMSHEYDTTRQT
jgi:ketosteroid isomerase-like protein